MATYTLAVDGGKDHTDFIRCVAWEKRAEFAERYMKKGRKFIVYGRIQTGSYNDRDGKKVYTTDIIVNNQEFADSKPDNEKPIEPEYAQPTWTDVGLEEMPFD